MGIPLRAGRDLTESGIMHQAKPVILINETLARALWPGREPIGQTATYVDVDGRWSVSWGTCGISLSEQGVGL